MVITTPQQTTTSITKTPGQRVIAGDNVISPQYREILMKPQFIVAFTVAFSLVFTSGCALRESKLILDVNKVGYTKSGCVFRTVATNAGKGVILRKVDADLYFYDSKGVQIGESSVYERVHLPPGGQAVIRHAVYESQNGREVCARTHRVVYEYKK